MGELAKIDSYKREIAIAETIEEVKNLTTKGEIMAEMAKKLKIPLTGQNELGKTRIELEKKKRELIEQMFPKGGDRGNQYIGGKVAENDLASFGITKDESSDAKIIKEEEDLVTEVMDEIEREGKVIEPKIVAVRTRKKKKEQEKKEKIDNLKEQSKDFKNDNIDIIHADFVEYSNNIKDNSIDLILTDPPYPGEFLYLWQDLFTISARVLKPSAFLICYSGQMYLDKIFRMDNELNYYWMANIIFTKKPLIHGRNIINEWKPILIFQKPPFKKILDTISDTISDKISFDYSERDMHGKNWGQTIKPFEFLIDKFSDPGGLVLEPFAGTGTTLIASQNMKRKCIGIEKEKEYIDLIKGRLMNEK